MGAPSRKPGEQDETAPDHIRISLEGSPAVVARLLAGMAGTLETAAQAAPQAEPEPLFLSRQEAAKRSGLSADRLSNLVKVGQLPNYGGPGSILLSLADIRAWQAKQQRREE